MRAVDTDRAFINMVLTKGEADQRGSRQARCMWRGTFQDGPVARGRRAGKHTPSKSILTKNKLVLMREKGIKRDRQIKSFSVCTKWSKSARSCQANPYFAHRPASF